MSIVTLCDLMEEKYSIPATVKWTTATLAHLDRLLVERSLGGRPYPRRREEPSIGSGSSKRATFPKAYDSGSSRPSTRRTSRPHPKKGKLHTVYATPPSVITATHRRFLLGLLDAATARHKCPRVYQRLVLLHPHPFRTTRSANGTDDRDDCGRNHRCRRPLPC